MRRARPTIAGGWAAALCGCLIAARATAAPAAAPAVVVSAPAAPPAALPAPRYFYLGLDYGSQSL
jgi:hypothetical protein